MKMTFSEQWRKPLSMALLLCGAWGLAVSAAADEDTARTAEPAAMDSGKDAGMDAGKAIAPGKAESAVSAFKKLDAGSKGYITMDDVAQLPGFDKAFQAADTKHSGRLTLNEFKKAWSLYTGNKG